VLASLTHVVDEVRLRFRRAGGRRDVVVVALDGAERFLQGAPPARGGDVHSDVDADSFFWRPGVPAQAVVEIAVQQAALVLGGRRQAAVAVGGVGPPVVVELAVLRAFQGAQVAARGPAEVTLLAGRAL